jgi:hypothetical protein
VVRTVRRRRSRPVALAADRARGIRGIRSLRRGGDGRGPFSVRPKQHVEVGGVTGGPAVEGIDVGLVRDVCRFDSRRTADPCAGGETEVLPGELFPKAGRRRRFVVLLPLGAPLCAHSPCVCVTRTGGALPPRAVTRSLCRRSCREASATNPLGDEAFASNKKKKSPRSFSRRPCGRTANCSVPRSAETRHERTSKRLLGYDTRYRGACVAIPTCKHRR